MKKFQTAGVCIPEKHYMVDVSARIDKIVSDYVEKGNYFIINRARQYGKTTTLYLLERKLKENYTVIRLSFEAADELFVSLYTLATGLIRKVGRVLNAQNIEESIVKCWLQPVSEDFPMDDLGERITGLCQKSTKKIVLMIDEVDKSADNKIFLSFLGLLRSKYLDQLQENDDTFQSVILAGVYDIKNLKLKLRMDAETKYNSPWNIAVDFCIDMSFSAADIETMLIDYEKDNQTGMDTVFLSKLIYDYTSGYPYLVSRICQILDDRQVVSIDGKGIWQKEGLLEAIRILLKESNSLYDDMIKHLDEYPKLNSMIQNILFQGMYYTFDTINPLIQIGMMFGFLVEKDGQVWIQNRIFETRLYNYFLTEEESKNDMHSSYELQLNSFVIQGTLQMDLVMKKFLQFYEDVYSDKEKRFLEEEGRRIFLMYLRPIINGAGNYYIEAQTRNHGRTDIIVDYCGRQYIIELKIWRGAAVSG